jgi:hypothetical protein
VVNITRKYRVASFAIIFQRLGKSSPRVFDLFAKKMISENTRESEVHVIREVSTMEIRFVLPRLTVEDIDPGIRNVYRSMGHNHTQTVCVKRYRGERLSWISTTTTKGEEPPN